MNADAVRTGWIGSVSARFAAARPPMLRNLLLAVTGGLLLFASFPPRPLWFLAPLGVAALTVALLGGTGKRAGFGYGFLAGLAFFVPLLPWIGIFVGPLPWLALSVACAVYLGLFGLAARIVARLPWAPVWIAAVWSLAEYGRANFPFGGFPWGRLAFGQADGFLLPLAHVGGAPLLSFAVALLGTALAAVLTQPHKLRSAALALVVVLAGIALWPTLPTGGDREITVAAIQGSVPRLGLEFNAQRRAVLDNHVKRTLQLADDVAAGRTPRPDVVIWPENSSDIDPLRNRDAYEAVTRASEAIGVPILVGAVLVNGDGTTTNAVIVWNGAQGPGERHDKRIIQPFGEYLPMRGFFRLFSEYADQAGYFVPGDGNGVVHAAGVPIGIATCYEVVFDRAFHDSVRNGAQLLAVPTNNATFGDSEMTYQQMAMSRVRAVEHGRAVVVSATSGVSAIIAPDGTVLQQTPLFTPEALVARVPLRGSTTLATRLGPIPEVLLCLAAAAAIFAAVAWRQKFTTNEGTYDEHRPGGRAQRADAGDHSDL